MHELKAVFSVTDLAVMANLSRHQMARLLSRAGVKFQRVGRKRLVYLSELRHALPSLWDSIEQYARLS